MVASFCALKGVVFGSLDELVNTHSDLVQKHLFGRAVDPSYDKFAALHAAFWSGGHFLYADFRFRDGFAEWETAIAGASLEIVQTRDIAAEVLRGMDCNAERNITLVEQRLPRFLHSSCRDFAGVPGSKVYAALQSGELAYRSWCFRKA